MGSCWSSGIKAEGPARGDSTTGEKSRRRNGEGSRSGGGGGDGSVASIHSIPRRSVGEMPQSSKLGSFSFNDLKTATRNFRPDSVLGEGGFGSVFKGWIDEHNFTPSKAGTGLVIAVKRLNQDGFQGHKEWLAEVNYLSRLEHPNLVKLLGYCVEDEQRLLVYEFMPKGSLENHLFRRGCHYQPLPWNLRMKIALGAARGLAFLHNVDVIYRDLKTSNVLLDSNYVAKLSDFGLAKDGPSGDKSHVTTTVMGTYGYAAPEYLATGHLTVKSDVYGYGVVLLEMICGRRVVEKNRPLNEHNLVEWVKPYLNNRHKIFQIVDNRLKSQYSYRGAQKVTTLALACLSLDPKKRPTMVEVVHILGQLQDDANRLSSLIS